MDYPLDITIIYHNMQYQQNLMDKSREMSKKTGIWREIDQKRSKSSQKFFLSKKTVACDGKKELTDPDMM